MRRLLLIALLGVVAYAEAQRAMPVGHFSGSRGAAISARPFRNPVPYLGSPFFTDSLFYDDLLNAGYPVASQPPIVIMPAAAPVHPSPAPDSAPTEALLIELHGDRYVRLSGGEASGAQMIDHGLGSPSSPDAPKASVTRAPAAAPTILVFRDGHREQVSEYSIANGVLYASASYYADGSWSKNIELSALNLPETVDANRSRAVPFRLPAAPNEVIVGP